MLIHTLSASTADVGAIKASIQITTYAVSSGSSYNAPQVGYDNVVFGRFLLVS